MGPRPGRPYAMQPKRPVEVPIAVFEAIARELIKPTSPQVSIRAYLSSSDLLGHTYIVTCNGDAQFLLRVLVPVEPVHRTWSEVATMAWVAQTLTPALDSDSDSRYESILMTKPAGRTLAQVWWDLLQPAREHINGNGNENRVGGKNRDSHAAVSLEVLQPPSPARPLSSDAEPTVITHSGLTRSTIFVDAQNNISGIVAWDCATALPLWEACQLPLFLIVPSSSTSSDPPDRRDFKHDVNGFPVAAYWARLQEYQLACLADVFLAEMRVVCPEWARLCTDDPLSRAICLVTVGAAKMAVERGDEDEMRRRSLTEMGMGIGLKSGKGVRNHN
ncbi:hypothetical protein F4809DRAFT_658417 [Biscogniauxia mediterranea]|nr:hypothetical protein F4809DRAFT_658417 [Biscogniauxia mediterranea]